MTDLAEIKEYLDKHHKFRIVFVGDSITSTEWVHPNWREIVEYVLKEELTKIIGDWKQPSWEVRGINCGFDGSTTKNILEKSEEILGYQPDLIIGLMGGNDVLFKINPEETKDNIGNFLKIWSNVWRVVWCTSTPAAYEAKKNKEYKPYAKATMSIEANKNVQLINMFEIFKQFDLNKFYTFKSEENPLEGVSEGGPDFWHPNQLGNAYIAKVILKEVFGVEFDPEKYIVDTLAGEKFPGY